MPPKKTKAETKPNAVENDPDFVKPDPKRVVMDEASTSKKNISQMIEVSKAKLFELENVYADKFEELDKIKKALREEKRILKALKYEFKNM